MANLRCTASLESRTGIPADRATNTYHFQTTGLTEAILDNIQDMMFDLYVNEPDATPLVEFMSNQLCGDAMGIQIYDLDDPEPRSPIRQQGWDITPISTPCLPAEVAMCVSFHGEYVSGEPQARRRGRVYVPWMQASSNVDGRPESTFVTLLAASFAEFHAAAIASANVNWVVWSPTDSAAYPVEAGWIDDAWDTQRRRGVSATYRIPWNG